MFTLVRRTTPCSAQFPAILSSLLLLCASVVPTPEARAQDWFKTETSSGATNIRIAVADFKPGSAAGQTDPLQRTFDATLYSDLTMAGIFDIASKSPAPQASPGTPAEMNLQQWSAAPASAAMVAFGSV